MQLYTSKQTRKIDNLAIKQKDISGYSLMQDAAEFSLNVLIQEWEKVEGNRIRQERKHPSKVCKW